MAEALSWVSAAAGAPIFLREDLPMTTGVDLAVLRTKARIKQWRVAAELDRSGAWLSQIENQEDLLDEQIADMVTEAINSLERNGNDS